MGSDNTTPTNDCFIGIIIVLVGSEFMHSYDLDLCTRLLTTAVLMAVPVLDVGGGSLVIGSRAGKYRREVGSRAIRPQYARDSREYRAPCGHYDALPGILAADLALSRRHEILAETRSFSKLMNAYERVRESFAMSISY